MTWPASFFFPHRVLIKKARPGGGMGPRPAATGVTVSAEVIDKRQLIRDANGREVISSTRVTVPVDTDAPLGSLVTVWPGRPDSREATVLEVSRDENAPPLPSHLILWLT